MRASIFCKIIISALLSALISMTGAAQISRETTANSYLERGIKWLSKGETERAKSDFDLAIASNPKADVAYCQRGVLKRTQGEFASAISDFNSRTRSGYSTASGSEPGKHSPG